MHVYRMPNGLVIEFIVCSDHYYDIRALYMMILLSTHDQIHPSLFSPHAVVDCGALDNPENEVVLSTDTTYNSVATYSCNAGYTLTGDDMRTCQSSGVWSGSKPTCTCI